jgi:hypothetical protein
MSSQKCYILCNLVHKTEVSKKLLCAVLSTLTGVEHRNNINNDENIRIHTAELLRKAMNR